MASRRERFERTSKTLHQILDVVNLRTRRIVLEERIEAARAWGYESVDAFMKAARKDPSMLEGLQDPRSVSQGQMQEVIAEHAEQVEKLRPVVAEMQDRVNAVQRVRGAELDRLASHLGDPRQLSAQARAALVERPLADLINSDFEGEDLSAAVRRQVVGTMAQVAPEAYFSAESAGIIDRQTAADIWDGATQAMDPRVVEPTMESAPVPEDMNADQAGEALDRMLRGEPARAPQDGEVEAHDPGVFPDADAGETDAGFPGDTGGADAAQGE